MDEREMQLFFKQCLDLFVFWTSLFVVFVCTISFTKFSSWSFSGQTFFFEDELPSFSPTTVFSLNFSLSHCTLATDNWGSRHKSYQRPIGQLGDNCYENCECPNDQLWHLFGLFIMDIFEFSIIKKRKNILKIYILLYFWW